MGIEIGRHRNDDGLLDVLVRSNLPGGRNSHEKIFHMYPGGSGKLDDFEIPIVHEKKYIIRFSK